MNPFSFSGRAKVHKQYERKAAKQVLSLLSLGIQVHQRPLILLESIIGS